MKIQKIDVANGIQWLNFPAADLRILCGCPADAVKHLAKRGLIVSQEVNGVFCETGPNAILLSDTLLQNGDFANLAEFPVLQMLYKQGLAIPNHPKNSGLKPMLIGSAEQIDSQMHYIYRGNYGLVSIEEIMATGIPYEQAHDMMRLKLKFAFGRICPSTDFLNTCVVGSGVTPIINGVSVRRIEPNVFEFFYEDETITVNLNLQTGKMYECSYNLGFRRFEPEYFAVIHSGDGDGWDVNRAAMSSIITFQGGIYLIDAGPHLLHTMAALGIGIHQIDGIFHTHAHDDHFAGLTVLMRAGRRICYYATKLVRSSVQKKLSALLSIEEERLVDFFDFHDLEFDQWNNIDGLEVMPVFSPHPVETNLFIFRTLWAEGYRTYAHFADITSLTLLKNMITEQPDAPGLSWQTYTKVEQAYLTPYDLKKIDVGGGMIHGDAKDFKNDQSSRILLAHRATEFTPEEKEIGSSAPFGTVDVLIKAQSNGFRRHAFSYLEANLPEVAVHDIRMLLNHPMIEINPGSILIKEGDEPSSIFLLLSGQVEKIRTRDNLFSTLSAGALIGDDTILHNDSAAQFTYRASSFVRLLELPLDLYVEVIRRNGLFESVKHFINMQAFLNKTSLFFESLPVSVLRRIIDGAVERFFPSGTIIRGNQLDSIHIIRSGLVACDVSGAVPITLKAGDFFGEECAVLKMPILFQFHVVEDTHVVQIPGNLIDTVPVLHWKIFNNHQKQLAKLIKAEAFFNWQNYFSINVAQMDEQHKKMIDISNKIMAHLYSNANEKLISDTFDALIECTRHHIVSEEKLLGFYNYPDLSSHSDSHEKFILQLTDYKKRVLNGEIPDTTAFMNFFEYWLIRHITNEDSKYGQFLNAKGVY